jgi:hypothetical protein
MAETIRSHRGRNRAWGDGAEPYLLRHATLVDVTGHRCGDIDADTVAAVVSIYPRPDFARGFTELVVDQAARKTGCWANRAIDGRLAQHVAAAPFESAS